MLSWSLNVFFLIWVSYLISVKPFTTEITENKTKLKICKITVTLTFFERQVTCGLLKTKRGKVQK